MRRWIALLLMLLLPLQVSWSVAAEYGTHGATLVAPHAGLHTQAHAHAGSDAESAGLDPAAPAGETDAACCHTACCDLHQCHTHGSFAALTATAGFAPLASTVGYATEQIGRLQSLEATRIERPQWAASPVSR